MDYAETNFHSLLRCEVIVRRALVDHSESPVRSFLALIEKGGYPTQSRSIEQGRRDVVVSDRARRCIWKASAIRIIPGIEAGGEKLYFGNEYSPFYKYYPQRISKGVGGQISQNAESFLRTSCQTQLSPIPTTECKFDAVTESDRSLKLTIDSPSQLQMSGQFGTDFPDEFNVMIPAEMISHGAGKILHQFICHWE
jgi:hypothetical protein